jgi:glycosyltransferase involved in cell wall biosynthesis
MDPLDKICILIPAYNADSTLGSVLEKIQPLHIETLVVNDGSVDETRDVALKYGVHLLEHPYNLGKGAALRTGFQYILQKDYEILITLDADAQHDPSEIPSLLKVFRSVRPDILIASRAGEFSQMTFLRCFWNRLGAKAVARLCHSDITDSQSGFQTELELLIKACKKGFSVLCVPTTISRIDGTRSSHFKPVADTWKECKLFLQSLFW